MVPRLHLIFMIGISLIEYADMLLQQVYPFSAELYLPLEMEDDNGEIVGESLPMNVSGGLSPTLGVLGNGMYLPGTAGSFAYLGERQVTCFWSPWLCTDGYSIAFWVNIHDKVTNTGYYCISTGGQTFASYGMSFDYHDHRNMRMMIKTKRRWWTIDCPLTKNQWHHVGMTWREDIGSTGFVNGTKCGEDPVGASNIRTSTVYNGFYLGSPNNRHETGFLGKGRLDEILFWPTLLPESHFLSVHKAYISPGGWDQRTMKMKTLDKKRLIGGIFGNARAENGLECVRGCAKLVFCLMSDWNPWSKICRFSNLYGTSNAVNDESGGVIYMKIDDEIINIK